MVKVAHTRLPSAGFRSWSQFLAVSPQVTWIINPTVGCHYFPPGLQLPPQPLINRTATSFAAWWTEAQWMWTVCLRLLPDSVAAAIWTRAFYAWVQHANHSATEPPVRGVVDRKLARRTSVTWCFRLRFIVWTCPHMSWPITDDDARRERFYWRLIVIFTSWWERNRLLFKTEYARRRPMETDNWFFV